ncbi:MAG: UbiH/UbiF family hydroxylase [Sideroxydans sp.]|nr:UbiH/UbiF family hydroxylase [Sideroxydans sp.]
MTFDVLIIGGGLVGASLAAALKPSGLSVALVESQPMADAPAPADSWDSRMYAISPGCAAFLAQSGVWQHLDMSRVQPVEKMQVFGDSGAELDFSAYQIGAPELAFILENRLLLDALWQELQQQDNLTLLQPAQCARLDWHNDAASLHLEDGREFRARLVIGADGRDSWVRAQAGISVTPAPYRQHGVVANFSVGKPHRGTAYQWFQPDGILALLPMPQQMASMVWSVSPERSAELVKLPHAELCAQVAQASNQMLGDLQVVTPPAAFPLRLLNLPHITRPRLALIGDAAHNVHPLAGQGVNLGFRDARQLAQILLQRGAQQDCGDAHLLRRYERARREDILSMQLTTDALKNLFNNDNPLLRTMRNLGLNATNRIAPLKKMLARHALN